MKTNRKHYRDGLEHVGPIRVKYLDMGAVAEFFGDGAIFVQTADGVGAHGPTVEEALLAAKSKLMDRSQIAAEISESAKKDGGEEHLFTVAEFRSATGACEEGTKLFLTQRGLPHDHRAKLCDIEKLTPEWGGALRRALKWSD